MLRSLHLLLAAIFGVVGAEKDIWLIGILPFTGSDWDAGSTIRFAAEMMMNDIVEQGLFLPGYRLRIIWQDARCSGSFARDILLQNAFDSKYFRFEDWPHTDTDGDGLISTAETLPGQVIWGPSEMSEPPVGIYGGGCSGESMAINNIAFRFRFPMVSPGSSNAALSDRSVYPNFFRTIMPDAAYLRGWCTLLRTLRVARMFPLVGETAIFKTNLVMLVDYAAEFDIEMVGLDLGSEVGGLRGFQLGSDSWSAALVFAKVLRESTVRVVVLQLYDKRARLALCAAAQAGLFAQFWLAGSTVAAGFWLRDNHRQIPGVEWCTKKHLGVVANGFIQANVAFWRADLNTALSCSQRTAGEFKEAFYTQQNVPVGSDSLSDRGYFVMGEGACGADAICMYAKAIHEILIVRNRSLADLQARDPGTYQEMFDILSVSDFQGLQGRMKYQPGRPEPDGGLTFSQVQLPGGPCLGMLECGPTALSAEWVLVATQASDSPDINFLKPMIFHYSDEVYPGSGLTASFDVPLAPFLECPRGEVYDMFTRQCAGCPENTTYFDSTRTCLCNRGRYGTSACTPCAAGSFSSTLGTVECDACPPGTFSNEAGKSQCARCPKGTFQSSPGSAQCQVCPAGTTTDGTGFLNIEACLCDAGSFQKAVGDPCEPCPKGMTCAFGSILANSEGPSPRVAAGFYAEVAAPMAPYKCLQEGACPGGPPGTCSGDRVGLTCIDCKPGMSLEGGQCTECGGGSGGGVLVLMLVLAFVCFTALHMAQNTEVSTLSRQLLTAGILLAMCVNFVLTISVLNTLSTVWVSPLSDMFNALSFFSFDFDVVGIKMSCTFGTNSHILRYSLKLLVFPVSFGLVSAGAFMCSRMSKLRDHASFNTPALQNTAGYLMQIFFISVGLASLEGFRCLSNPNGRWTLQANTSVVCWKGGEHAAIVVLSIIAILAFPVTFLSLMGWICHFYGPLSQKYGISFTARARFVSTRMHPDHMMFSFAWNVRSFAIALWPVLASGVYQAQVGLIMATLVSWLCLQTYFKCWRFQWVNIADAALGSMMIMVLFGFSLWGSAEQGMEESACGWFIISLTICTIALLLGSAGYYAMKYASKQTGYSVFITHHKAAAALYARHIKMLFDFPGSIAPFLDVDDLDHLDCLTFAVNSSRLHMVVLSPSVLERPWCVVEITSAYLNKVPGVLAQINDEVTDLSKGYINRVISSYSSQDWSILSQAGVNESTVRSAFETLSSNPKFALPLRSGNQDLSNACVRDILRVGGGKLHSRRRVHSLDTGKEVYLVYNTTDALQCSAAFVAMKLFEEHHWHAHLCCLDGGGHLTIGGTGVGVVFLSKGLQRDPIALGAILALSRAEIDVVTVLSQECFSKPSAEFLGALWSGQILSQEEVEQVRQLALGATLEEIASVLAPLYTILASGFNPEHSERLMRAEFKIIEKRAANKLVANVVAPTASMASATWNAQLDNTVSTTFHPESAIVADFSL